MKVTYFGTTMLLFDDGQTQVLFDCHVTRPSLLTCFAGKLVTNKTIADSVMRDYAFDRLQGIFISHTHHDHVMDAPYFAKHCNAPVYGSSSALNVCRGDAVPEDQLHAFDTSATYRIGGFHITVLPSLHSPAHWYNNDLGQTIDTPLVQPARKKDYKEGGSFDFWILHRNTQYLIRPSYNYLEGQLDHISADVLFLGIGGLSGDTSERQRMFFQETIDKVHPKIVVPIHWDNFFSPLNATVKPMHFPMDNSQMSMQTLEKHCQQNGIQYILQQPLSSIECS